jgi:hypothetical protein
LARSLNKLKGRRTNSFRPWASSRTIWSKGETAMGPPSGFSPS